jgi:hypothetical protein
VNNQNRDGVGQVKPWGRPCSWCYYQKAKVYINSKNICIYKVITLHVARAHLEIKKKKKNLIGIYKFKKYRFVKEFTLIFV